MNYAALYARFIASRQGRVFSPGEYSERHHIVPRCEGGGDEPENLIRLTARDHLFAHLILAKWKGGKHWASVSATFGNSVRRGELPTAQVVRVVALSRQKFGESIRGDKHPGFGVKRSPETREKISTAQRGYKHPMFGAHHSPETRGKMSAAQRGNKNPMFGRTGNEHPMFGRTGNEHPMFGARHSPEIRAKISAAAREQWAHRKALAQGSTT
jgi:hypothetical protein